MASPSPSSKWSHNPLLIALVSASIGALGVMATGIFTNHGESSQPDTSPGVSISTENKMVTRDAPPPVTITNFITENPPPAEAISLPASDLPVVSTPSPSPLQVEVTLYRGDEFQPGVWRDSPAIDAEVKTTTASGDTPSKCFTTTELLKGAEVISTEQNGYCNYSNQTLWSSRPSAGDYEFRVTVVTGDGPADPKGSDSVFFTIAP